MSDFSRDFAVRHGADGLGIRSCQIAFRCFDCSNSITVYSREGFSADPGPERAEELLLEARRSCLRYHAMWSFADPESDIARINAPVRAARVQPETVSLLRHMLRFHADEPAFDFTIGAASYLWKRVRETGELPGDAEVREALGHVGAGKLRVERAIVSKDDPLLQVDVGGAAKGFVANDISAFLRDEGVACADVDLGGNLYLVGEHPEERPWHLEVALPESVPADRADLRFEAADTSVVTSSSFERTVEIDGKGYQHIIDPATCWPSGSDIVSATVLCADSVHADMLATTALLAGSAGFDALMTRHSSAACIAVTRDGRVLRSGIESVAPD